MSDVEPCNNSNNDEEDISSKIQIINKIIKMKLDKWTTADIMKKQLFIINFIRRNIIFFINDDKNLHCMPIIHKYVKWIMSSLWYICSRDNLEIIEKKTHSGTKIHRSSYHFCPNTYECTNLQCDKHHFVYDLLYSDVRALYNYLVENTLKYNIKEIMKSVNTIQYVIKHILIELTSPLSF